MKLLQPNQATFMLLGALAATALAMPVQPARVVYNASASVPIGYYEVTSPERVRVGDQVLVQTPQQVSRMADDRHYLPADVPMIKGVAALAPDEVCAAGETVSINGKAVVFRQRADRLGRPLPQWQGCHRLAGDDIFLLNASNPYSFDGRYFGVVSKSLILGKVRRL